MSRGRRELGDVARKLVKYEVISNEYQKQRRTAGNSEKQRTVPLFFGGPDWPQARISAEKRMPLAVNFGKNSENGEEGVALIDTEAMLRAWKHSGVHLPIEPDVFHAPAIVLAVDHDGQASHLRLHTGGGAGVVDDRARAILLQLLVDLPNEAPALLLIGHRRLLDKQLFEIGIAITGVVSLRPAAVILEELLVGIIDAAAGIMEAAGGVYGQQERRVYAPFPAGMNGAARSVPRRSLLQMALSAVVALVAPAARAQQKFSKAAADYQDMPKNGLTCAACSLFRPPQSCAAVEGDISPNGWCKFFDLPD